jgi:hypothetical protein
MKKSFLSLIVFKIELIVIMYIFIIHKCTIMKYGAMKLESSKKKNITDDHVNPQINSADMIYKMICCYVIVHLTIPNKILCCSCGM